MPIEFTCTQCEKQIKLPDVTAGLRGKCPHCQNEFVAPQPNLPSFEEMDETILRKEYPEGFREALDAQTKVTSPSPSPFPLNAESVLAEAQNQKLPHSLLTKPVTPTPIANELRRKQQYINPVAIWFPVLLMVAVVVIAVWAAWNTAPKLSGKLVARRFPHNQLPSKMLRYSELVSRSGLSEDELKTSLAHLQENPIPVMRGEDGLMNVRLEGAPAGLTVTVIQPVGMKIVRVGLLDEKLKQYLKDHQEEFDRQHTDELDLAIKDFFQDYKRSLDSGEAVKNLVRYRYQLCLNSLKGGIGYHLVAAVDQRAYLCIYEDDDHSGVYFLVPENTKSFRLQGRELAHGQTVFEGIFEVIISKD